MDQQPRLVPFDAAGRAPSTNGHRGGKRRRHRVRLSPGLLMGFMAGALFSASLVERPQWLNLGRVGWWGRVALAAAAAGALTGLLRRDRPAIVAASGAIAATFSLLLVYALSRVAVPVLWVGESAVWRIARDAGYLVAFTVPFGAAAAATVHAIARRVRRDG